MRALLLPILFTALAYSAKAQQLQISPDSVLLQLRKSNPNTQKLLEEYDRYHQKFSPQNAATKYVCNIPKGELYVLADGMPWLKPTIMSPVYQQAPGLKLVPKPADPINPIPNPLAPKKL